MDAVRKVKLRRASGSHLNMFCWAGSQTARRKPGGWAAGATDGVGGEGESDRMESRAWHSIHHAGCRSGGSISRGAWCRGSSGLRAAAQGQRHLCGLRTVEADSGRKQGIDPLSIPTPSGLCKAVAGNRQNWYRRATCISRGAMALTAWPKLPLEMLPSTAEAPKNCAWLNKLKASARNSSERSSFTRKLRETVASRVHHAWTREETPPRIAHGPQRGQSKLRGIKHRCAAARIGVQIERCSVPIRRVHAVVVDAIRNGSKQRCVVVVEQRHRQPRCKARNSRDRPTGSIVCSSPFARSAGSW